MKIKATVTGRALEPVRFQSSDMGAIAEVATLAMHERIGRAVTVQDTAAAPLSRRYAREKAGLGLPAIRDWKVTGETMAQLRVQDVQAGAVTVGIQTVSSAKLIRLARWNGQFDQMVGLSANDQARVLEAQEALYAEKHERRMK